MKKFSKAAILIASVALVLGLVACPNKAEPEPEPTPTPTVQLLRITVTPIYTGEYFVGDTITNDDIAVTATYTDGNSKRVTTWSTNEAFTSVATNKEITISYTEDKITKTAPLTITIVNEYTITYSFTNTATALDSYTGTAGSEKSYVEFGDWPQGVKSETVRILERQKLETGFFTYYAGSDGNWYVKQEEKAYSTGDAYKYSDGSVVKQATQNSTRYFKVEPIKWRVLEEKDGKKFLLAENCLMAVQYYDNTSARTIGGKNIYSNNYMHSKIRAFLNGYKYQLDASDNTYYETKGFLQTAFTSEAQTKIATTTVDNSVASTGVSSNSYVCDNTNDKVFLLSAKEATTASYGFSTSTNADNPRIRKPTDFALATGAYNSGGALGGVWWLRSPNSHSVHHARYISSDGHFYDNSVSWGGAVVPALLITP